MTVPMEKPDAIPQSLEAVLDELELPLGFKAELIEGEISVTSPPNGEHDGFFSELTYEFSRKDWRVSGGTGLITPLGRFIPDLTVARRDYFRAAPQEHWRHPDGVELVVEITSSKPSNDRESKRRGYAAAGIPLYLLVERSDKQTVLFSRPQRGDYRVREPRPISEPIPLPAPFDFTLTDFA